MNKKNVFAIVVCLLLGLVGNTGAIAEEKKTAYDYFTQGIELMEEGKLVDAENLFAEAVKLDPEHIYYRYAWAISLGGNDKYSEAVNELKKVVEKSPDLPQAWYYLRIFWLKSAGSQAAKEYFAKMAKKYTDKPYVHLNYAYILLEEKDYENAEKEIKKAIELRKNYSEAYFCLAKVQHDWKQDIDGAIEYYKKAIAIDPEFAEAYFNLGLLLRKKNNIDEAEKNFEMAKKLKPSLEVLLAKSSTRGPLTLRGANTTEMLATVTLIIIHFPGTKAKIIGHIKDTKTKAQKVVDQAMMKIKELPEGRKMELVFGKEKGIFDFRNTPNFYLTVDKPTELETEITSDQKQKVTKVNLKIRKIPDINLRFDPEGVIIEDTNVTKGYTRQLDKNRKIEVVDVLPEESKVIILVHNEL